MYRLLQYPSEKSRLDFFEHRSALALVIVWKEFDKVGFVHVGAYSLQYVFQPLVRIDAECLARYHEGVKDGIVLGATVVLAEEVILAPENRWTLTLFDGIAVDVIVPVFGIPFHPRPK